MQSAPSAPVAPRPRSAVVAVQADARSARQAADDGADGGARRDGDRQRRGGRERRRGATQGTASTASNGPAHSSAPPRPPPREQKPRGTPAAPSAPVRACSPEEWTLKHAVLGVHPDGIVDTSMRVLPSRPGSKGERESVPAGPDNAFRAWVDAAAGKIPKATHQGPFAQGPDALVKLARSEWTRGSQAGAGGASKGFSDELVALATHDVMSQATVSRQEAALKDASSVVAAHVAKLVPGLDCHVEAFGSLVQETATASSDLDLTLVGTVALGALQEGRGRGRRGSVDGEGEEDVEGEREEHGVRAEGGVTGRNTVEVSQLRVEGRAYGTRVRQIARGG